MEVLPFLMPFFVATTLAVVGLIAYTSWARKEAAAQAAREEAMLWRCPSCGESVEPDASICDECFYIPAVGRCATPAEVKQAQMAHEQAQQEEERFRRDRKVGCLWIAGLLAGGAAALTVVAVGIFAYPLPTIALCAVVLIVWLVFFRRR